MASFLLPFLPVGIGALYAEHKLLPALVDGITQPALKHVLTHPRSIAFVLLVNVFSTGFFMIYLGMKVGKARKLCGEKAKKDGEKDAEARYSLPNQYVDGNSVHAKKFNCVQRGHQQALETYPQFLALSLCGGYRFPLLTTFLGLLWMYSRNKWAQGYASGNPDSRYQHWASKGIWISLLFGSLATFGTALCIMELI
jgi:glutathione S-transferase